MNVRLPRIPPALRRPRPSAGRRSSRGSRPALDVDRRRSTPGDLSPGERRESRRRVRGRVDVRVAAADRALGELRSPAARPVAGDGSLGDRSGEAFKTVKIALLGEEGETWDVGIAIVAPADLEGNAERCACRCGVLHCLVGAGSVLQCGGCGVCACVQRIAHGPECTRGRNKR